MYRHVHARVCAHTHTHASIPLDPGTVPAARRPPAPPRLRDRWTCSPVPSSPRYLIMTGRQTLWDLVHSHQDREPRADKLSVPWLYNLQSRNDPVCPGHHLSALNTEHASYLILCDSMDLAHQASLSMEFSRQEYWSGLPCPPSGDLPDPGFEPESHTSPVLVGGFFEHRHPYNDYLVSVPGIVLSARKQGRTGSDLSPLHPPPPFPSMTHPRLWKSAAGCAAPCGEGSPEPLPAQTLALLPAHHQQVVEEEHLPLVRSLLLQLVHVRHLEESAAADQAAMWHRENLGGGTQCSTGGGGAVTP